jgi:hypothetical protein
MQAEDMNTAGIETKATSADTKTVISKIPRETNTGTATGKKGLDTVVLTDTITGVVKEEITTEITATGGRI